MAESVRLAYFGPEGTFTEAALLSVAPAGATLLPYPTVPGAIEAVRRGDAAAAMVPIENSVEGAVPATLDQLATGSPLRIVQEVLLPVTFTLMAPPGVTLADITRIGTFPHAEAQCRGWLSANLPHATFVPTPSTAAAAASLQLAGHSDFDAAVAARIAAERYGLDVLAEGIGDTADAVTRFVMVARPGPPPLPTGADRTSVVAFIAADQPGALLTILTEFAVRGVNLTRIESRPTGAGLGRYSFSMDCEGHIDDARVGEALMGLHRVVADVRFLGSYARADVAGTTRPSARSTAGNTGDDAAFTEAQAWLARLRDAALRS